jgi:hypothetical protein|uniref:Uncharacterized protein n=1 Tax=Picea glauca TaxID=3330 RepID=A0A124GP15_PICGL|nr:hypothetical protein ABT39_MTgene385 [Picea glauca]QHR92210.1 hypothetical protein Q903MT_gene6247 [Picea sitchensis]
MDKDISVLGPATSPNDLIEGAGNYICHYAGGSHNRSYPIYHIVYKDISIYNYICNYASCLITCLMSWPINTLSIPFLCKKY